MTVSPVPDTLELEQLDLEPLDAVLDRFEGRAGAAAVGSLIPILQAAQAIYGYLPPEVLQSIADRLNLSLGKIYGVATFYAQFYLERAAGTSCAFATAPLATSRARRPC